MRAALVLALLCLPAAAGAEVNIWQETIDPSLGRARPLLEAVEATLAMPDPLGASTLLEALGRADGARRLRPGDPRVRHLRGQVLYRLERWQEAAAELAEAVRLDPGGPLAPEASFDLGVALTRLERFAEAAAAYARFLEESPWPRARAIALTNLAETRMAEGLLDDAVSSYRAALGADPRYPHAHLGLAVALDRMGDEGGGRAAMRAALSSGPVLEELDSPAVFFVPAWEHHYYRALAHETLGEDEEARLHFRAFLDEGGSSGPFAARAGEHLAELAARRRPGTP